MFAFLIHNLDAHASVPLECKFYRLKLHKMRFPMESLFFQCDYHLTHDVFLQGIAYKNEGKPCYNNELHTHFVIISRTLQTPKNSTKKKTCET